MRSLALASLAGVRPYTTSRLGGTDFEDTYNASKVPAIPQHLLELQQPGTTDGSAKSYIPEIPWNDSCAGYLLYNYARFRKCALRRDRLLQFRRHRRTLII
jgi:hypothetical protein